MIEYEIPFVCLIFTTIITIVFFAKKKVDLEENYYYKNILIFTLLVIKYGFKIYRIGILNYSGNNLWKKIFHAIRS